MSKKLNNKVAIVTGASKGIGAAIAKALAAEGANVIVNYASSKSGADKVVAEIVANGGSALAVQADVSKKADVDALLATAQTTFGRLDILVNNAGIYEMGPLESVTEDSFHRQFNLNVLGPILTIQAALPLFGSDGGSIINISSAVTTLAPANTAVYSGTKGAVDVITRALAKELGGRNIRVNAINPGLVETEGVHTAGIAEGGFRTWIESTAPLGRIGRPDDIAPAAVFLASADSQYLTGETLIISGGLR